MKKETYERLTRSFRNKPQRVKVLILLNKSLTLLVYFAYPCLLMVLAIQKDERLWPVFATPAISFVLVSVFRKYYNAPRPYETLDIIPLISKDTKGNSFPSRHVFSVFVIAMVFLSISILVGISLLLIGIFLALIRVIGGVHYPKDVIAGAAIGILSGILGLYFIH
ncbi:MAG: phosphatase PAP2 family protein [Bacillaceae bacterium]|nr:phosphatase PAP2 family protein [Bacillaceae bacterium]